MTRLLMPLAVLALLAARAWAQQPVVVDNLGYDPCADPARVQVLGLNLSADTGSVELVPISGITRILVCSLTLQGGSAVVLYLHFGTGTACAADQSFISYVRTAGLAPKYVYPDGGATFARSETARAFCIFRDASTTLKGHLRYVQE